ncbi:MAG: DUF1015 domain-containing protein [Acidimicrobiales bacterium]
MPRFEPFAGLRYEAGLDLDRLIAPPYDVVGPKERADLAARNRANAIHIELPVADRTLRLDPYSNAARLLEGWRTEGVLVRDSKPAFYRYRMTMPEGGKSTTGVIGALGIEPPGDEVLPHEQTIAKDETDRLALIRSAKANLSPIWGLSLTDGLSRLSETEEKPTSYATDDAGVLHELWVVNDQVTMEAISLAVSSNPVVLADGHHRYSVSRRYRDEQRTEHDGVAGPYDLVMAFIVELEEGGLHVGPIHRAISKVPGRRQLLEAAAKWFEVVDAGPRDDSLLSAVVSSHALAMVAQDRIWLLTPRPEAYETTNSDLDSSFVALLLEEMPDAVSNHFHTWMEATDAVESGHADVALLVRPVTVDQIREWARARRLMPPKSTYFFPKPRTGMVYRTLED